MRTKVIILGLRSIGDNLLKELKKIKKFEIILLTANRNHKKYLQANEFKVKNLIVNNKKVMNG